MSDILNKCRYSTNRGYLIFTDNEVFLTFIIEQHSNQVYQIDSLKMLEYYSKTSNVPQKVYFLNEKIFLKIIKY